MRDIYSHHPGMVRSRLRRANIPERLRGNLLPEVEQTLARVRPANAIREWDDAVRSGKVVEAEGMYQTCGVGLWIVGTQGSAVACALIQALIIDEVIDSALHVRTHDYLESERPQGSGEFRERAEESKILVLSGYGTERRNNESGWAVDTLDNLIASRFDRGLPSIVTTNMKPPASFCGNLAAEVFSVAAIMEAPREED